MTEMEVTFDGRHHSVDAIQRAAYRFSDRLTVDIVESDCTIVCRLTPLYAAEVGEVVASFKVEVLDQVLRERIREETREVRNLVLALAFSNVVLDDPRPEA